MFHTRVSALPQTGTYTSGQLHRENTNKQTNGAQCTVQLAL